MNDYLVDEEENYTKRKTKIFDHYIALLKEQKEDAKRTGNKEAAGVIGLEIIKILEMKSGTSSAPSPTTNAVSKSGLPKAPKIDGNTKFSDIQSFYNTHKKLAKVVNVDISSISKEINVAGRCLVAPIASDKWTVMKGKSMPVDFKGFTRSPRKIKGQAPGRLCYSINDGPWEPVDAVEIIDVKGVLKFSSNTEGIRMLKGRSEGNIRVRVLPVE